MCFQIASAGFLFGVIGALLRRRKFVPISLSTGHTSCDHGGNKSPTDVCSLIRQRLSNAPRISTAVATPDTLAQWVGQCGVQLQPLVDALRAEVLASSVLHADETPVQMLKPGAGKTHRAYLWAYAAGRFEPLRAVIYDFCESRAGKHASSFLAGWRGHLMVDDYAGYNAVLSSSGVIELGCMAHARRKFFDLQQAGTSAIGAKALTYFGQIYDIERTVVDAAYQIRHQVRQQHTRLNGHDPYAYMKDVLQRLPTQKMSAIGELLPHRWQPAGSAHTT